MAQGLGRLRAPQRAAYCAERRLFTGWHREAEPCGRLFPRGPCTDRSGGERPRAGEPGPPQAPGKVVGALRPVWNSRVLGRKGCLKPPTLQLYSEEGSFREAVAPPPWQRPTKASSVLGPQDQWGPPWSPPWIEGILGTGTHMSEPPGNRDPHQRETTPGNKDFTRGEPPRRMGTHLREPRRQLVGEEVDPIAHSELQA